MGGLGFLDPIKVALKCASVWELMMSLESVSPLVESRSGCCRPSICFRLANYPSADLRTWASLEPVVSKRLKMCKLSLTGSHLLHPKAAIQLVQTFVLIFSLVETKERTGPFLLCAVAVWLKGMDYIEGSVLSLFSATCLCDSLCRQKKVLPF